MHLAKNNHKRIFPYIITAIIISCFILVFSNTSEARESARDKACFSNIRVIQGAVEMYNMDNEIMIDSINDYYMDILVKGKYLKSKPQYPDHNCKYEGKNLTKSGIVYCKYHGDPVSHMVNNELAPYWKELQEKAKKQKREIILYLGLIIAIVVGISLFSNSSKKQDNLNQNNL